MGEYHKYTVIAAYDINSCGHLDFDREAYEEKVHALKEFYK